MQSTNGATPHIGKSGRLPFCHTARLALDQLLGSDDRFHLHMFLIVSFLKYFLLLFLAGWWNFIFVFIFSSGSTGGHTQW